MVEWAIVVVLECGTGFLFTVEVNQPFKNPGECELSIPTFAK